MPVLARFNGITIRMYFQQAEHNPPHIHAAYGEYAAAVAIKTGAVLGGFMPARALLAVQQWVCLYRSDLLTMWETQTFRKLPPLL